MRREPADLERIEGRRFDSLTGAEWLDVLLSPHPTITRRRRITVIYHWLRDRFYWHTRLPGDIFFDAGRDEFLVIVKTDRAVALSGIDVVIRTPTRRNRFGPAQIRAAADQIRDELGTAPIESLSDRSWHRYA
jgi:hypothetical protein